jgi:hypothetical protein
VHLLKEQPLHPDTSVYNGVTRGCHDIAAFPAIGLAAAACLSEGQIWDISDPANPDTLRAIRIRNRDLSSWHSASFTWDGSLVAFGDEAFGGQAPACGAFFGPRVGAVWLYRVADRKLLDRFKIPRRPDGDCTVHDYNFISAAPCSILVSAWFQGGISIAE